MKRLLLLATVSFLLIATAEEINSLPNYKLIVKNLRESNTLAGVLDELVKSGEFCKLRGHIWGQHVHLTLEYRTDNPQYRECVICKTVQTRTESDWK